MPYKAALSGGLFIAIVSFIPGKQLPDEPFGAADLVVHFGLYFSWMLAILLEGHRQYSFSHDRLWLVGKLILVVAYGGLVEVVQEQWVPGRYGDWTDFLANGAGAVAGFIIMAKRTLMKS